MSAMKNWEHLQIPFADIKNATNDFGKTIGRGGYGCVYEGEFIINGKSTKVAVKRLNERSGQGLKEFLTEIHLLSGQQHENIITLVGYCDEGNEKIIVYEYAQHGSLDRYIRRSNTNYTLTWLERLKTVVDVARGVDHLHNHLGRQRSIIHRDIKCTNILIDDKWVAKISDLGLSKLTISGFDASMVISNPCGTLHYVEPEYYRTGIATKKSDVYSFGLVLFELLCGRLSNIRETDNILLTPDLAKEYYDDYKLDTLIDPFLRKQMSPESLSRFSAIAYKCLQRRQQRPVIEVVKKELEEILNIQIQHEETQMLRSLSISSEEDIIDDKYWGKKLPNRYQRYIQRSDNPLHYSNKKELYFLLCHGFLCDNGKMWISQSNNKICSILRAAEILSDVMAHEDLDSLSLAESRFSEVKVLGYASSYTLACTLQLQMFSPQKMYSCYLVFKFEHEKQPHDIPLFTVEYSLDHHFMGKVLVHMNVFSRNNPAIKLTYDNQELGTKGFEIKNKSLECDIESWIEERKDGWMEVMLSKPLYRLEDYSTLKVQLSKVTGSFKGIIIEGIELRPCI